MQKIANTNNETIAIVILAGGQARRMGGGDKALMLIRGRPILHYILARLQSHEHAYRIAINANPAGDRTAEQRFAEFRLPVFGDGENFGFGPLAGILAGMRYFAGIEPAPTHVLYVAGDVPFIPPDLPQRFLQEQRSTNADIIFAGGDGRRHPVISLWRISLQQALASALASNIRKIEDFTDNYDTRTVEFSAEECHSIEAFFNVNTPQDLQKAEAWLSSHAS